MERRKPKSQTQSTSLPLDYLKMVTDVFNQNFKKELKSNSKFEAHGQIFLDEVVLAISLLAKGSISATTVYASTDFDPKTKGIESIQELLGTSVDAIASVFGQLQLDTLVEAPLVELENVPFEWTLVTLDQKKIYLKLDKANPNLDQITDAWLEKNDPDYAERVEKERKATEDLFMTGPKNIKKNVH